MDCYKVIEEVNAGTKLSIYTLTGARREFEDLRNQCIGQLHRSIHQSNIDKVNKVIDSGFYHRPRNIRL